MNRDSQLTLPPAPNLIGAIRSGFDAIANHIVLILFPIALDLFLWTGPRLKLTGLIKNTSDQLFKVYSLQDPGMAELIQPVQEAWTVIAEQFNLLAILRTYPVGITSLLVSQLPLSSPFHILFPGYRPGSSYWRYQLESGTRAVAQGLITNVLPGGNVAGSIDFHYHTGQLSALFPYPEWCFLWPVRIIDFRGDRFLVDPAPCVLPTWNSYEPEQFL
jgi:hypothetical protein